MLRLLLLDLDIIISAWLVLFLIANIRHLIDIIRAYPNYKWGLLEEGRHLIPLLIFAVLLVINYFVPIENIGYSRYLIWFLIFLSFIIFRCDYIFKKR